MRYARTAAVLTGVSLAFPGAALGQGTTTPDGRQAPPLSNSSPSSPSSPPSSASRPRPASAPVRTAPRLANTGADAGLLALLGTGLLLTGAGMRLRLREPSAVAE